MQVFDGGGGPEKVPAAPKAGLFRIIDRGARRVPEGVHELAFRESDGIWVRLSWDARGDEIFVHVRNERDNEEFVLNPPKPDALFAFYHPYAAARRVPEPGRIAA